MLLLSIYRQGEAQPFRRLRLEGGRLLIGRDPPDEPGAERLKLEDSTRTLSRLHATIQFREGRAYLTDTSTNGVFVNRSPEPLGKNHEHLLQDGDELLIGNYRISVELPSDSLSTPPTSEATEILLKTEIPLKDALEGPTENPAPQPREEQEWLEALLELPGEAEEQSGPSPQEGQEHPSSPLEEAFVPPSPESRCETAEEPPAQTSRPIQALIEGLGLEGKLPPDKLEEPFFWRIGQLLRIAIRGLVDLLRARAEMKSELHLSATVLGIERNNPLKFSPNLDEAIRHLIWPEEGDMEPREAVQEAVDDLVAHQIALISGMQAALKEVIERFDPERLEEKVDRLFPMAAHIPLQRHLRLWQLYRESYTEVAQQLEEDLFRYFSHTFICAYEAQISKLKRARHGG